MSSLRDREAARALNVLAFEGLADLGTTDGPALTAFIHKFFGREDPAGYDSPGKLTIFSMDLTSLNN